MKTLATAVSLALLFGGAAHSAVIFPYTGSVQSWVVPDTGVYDLTGYGAAGGAYLVAIGEGAEIGGDVPLQAGEVLNIIVGGVGGPAISGNTGAGGGGATWVFLSGSTIPLLVAGGGGGDGYGENGGGGAGQAVVGAPGSGSGGAGGPSTGGGGGAGWLGAGGDGAPGTIGNTVYANGTGGQSAPSFAGGSIVGLLFSTEPPVDIVTGGYGGGGGAGYNGGGGGGGYTGGAGGGSPTGGGGPGGGGTSYLSSGFYNVTALAGVQSGDGSLDISAASPAPEPPTWALMFAGLAMLLGASAGRQHLLRRGPRPQ